MKTKDLTLIAIMIAIMIVCSQIALPIGPIPMTLQTLSVLLIGYILSPKHTIFATSLYLLMGLVGLPVFSGFNGGFQAILLPSFGFILGFIPAAYLQALYLKKIQSLKMKHLLISGFINFGITYAVGLPYMALILNVYLGHQIGLTGIFMAGLIPFIPGDLFKLVIGSAMAKRLLPVVQKRFAAI